MITSLADAALFAIAIAVTLATLPGTLYLLILSVAGSRKPSVSQRRVTGPAAAGLEREPMAIVVPAHNESDGIARTLKNLLAIARSDGATRVVVIADNCTDDTAAIAHSLGARVIERQDDIRRGKGYALDHAFRMLATEGFGAYVVIDADSVADANLIESLREHFARGAVAVQARYTVLNAERSPRTRLAELALCAINCLRPRGRHALGLSAGILGNGFALRRSVLERVPYTATSVVEDVEYHLRLIESGIRVHFADETTVRGEMPVNDAGRKTQRARWEGGRLRLLMANGIRLGARVGAGNLRLAEPLFDLLLLPLGYHALLLLSLLAMPFGWARVVGAAGILVLGGHVIVAARIGRLSARGLASALAHLPAYLVWKVAMIGATLSTSRASTRWIRTDRETPCQR